jgi:hypothetical protein
VVFIVKERSRITRIAQIITVGAFDMYRLPTELTRLNHRSNATRQLKIPAIDPRFARGLFASIPDGIS